MLWTHLIWAQGRKIPINQAQVYITRNKNMFDSQWAKKIWIKLIQLRKMASTLCCNRAFTVLSSRRVRLPLVGAFCVLSLGLSNFIPSSSYSLKSGPFAPLLRSRVGNEEKVRTVHSIRMAGNSNTVPSVVVYVTVPNKEAGKRLAESIVREKLAACVNRVPGVESVYEWEGKVQTDSEELLIIKTRESLLDALTEHVKANHEYDVPEVIALPITGGSLQYLEWIKNSTRD